MSKNQYTLTQPTGSLHPHPEEDGAFQEKRKNQSSAFTEVKPITTNDSSLAALPMTQLTHECRSLADENVELRKYLNLVLENCGLNTANVLVTVMSMCDDKLKQFLTGRINRDGKILEQPQDTVRDNSGSKWPSPKRISFADFKPKSNVSTTDRVTQDKYEPILPSPTVQHAVQRWKSGRNFDSYGGSFREVNFSDLKDSGQIHTNASSRLSALVDQNHPLPTRPVSAPPESPSYGKSFKSIEVHDLNRTEPSYDGYRNTKGELTTFANQRQVSNMGQNGISRTFQEGSSYRAPETPSYGKSCKEIGVNELDRSGRTQRSDFIDEDARLSTFDRSAVSEAADTMSKFCQKWKRGSPATVTDKNASITPAVNQRNGSFPDNMPSNAQTLNYSGGTDKPSDRSYNSTQPGQSERILAGSFKDSLDTSYNTVLTHQSSMKAPSIKSYMDDSLSTKQNYTRDSLNPTNTASSINKYRAFDSSASTNEQQTHHVYESQNTSATERLIGQPQASSTPRASPRDSRKLFYEVQQTSTSPFSRQDNRKITSSINDHYSEVSGTTSAGTGQQGEISITDRKAAQGTVTQSADLSDETLAQIIGFKGQGSSVKAHHVYHRAVDLLTNYRPSLTSNLTGSLARARPSRRIVGEMAFQLDRRILEHVFAFVGIGKSPKRRSRYYGFSVANIHHLISKESTRHQESQPEMKEYLNHRLLVLLQDLSKTNYDLDRHGEFTQQIVNKYGLLSSLPDADTLEGAWFNDPGSLRVLISQALRNKEELSDMLVVLDTLCFMAFKDNKPLAVW